MLIPRFVPSSKQGQIKATLQEITDILGPPTEGMSGDEKSHLSWMGVYPELGEISIWDWHGKGVERGIWSHGGGEALLALFGDREVDYFR